MPSSERNARNTNVTNYVGGAVGDVVQCGGDIVGGVSFGSTPHQATARTNAESFSVPKDLVSDVIGMLQDIADGDFGRLSVRARVNLEQLRKHATS
jgi:hypothetical protein